MSISVSGKHIEIGESLKEKATQGLAFIVEKYMEEIISAEVVFAKFHNQFDCKITVHVSHGLTIHSEERNDDAYNSLAQTLHKLESQIKRYKDRLNKQRRVSREELLNALAQKRVVKREEEDNDKDEPIIIAEMNTEIYTLSVKDAVMRMDLNDSNFMLFKSAATGNFSLVYKRKDGNIGWIETK